MKNFITSHFFLILLIPASILWGQNTYVSDDNFGQALIVLGYDDIWDDYMTSKDFGTGYINVE